MLVSKLLLAMALVLGTLPLLLTVRFKRRLRELRAGQGTKGQGSAALILPCKGLDPGFEDNVRALLEQDYPELELVFVVATQDDPAFDPLQRLLASAAVDHPRTRTALLVAGISNKRAQKLTNQLAAVQHVSQRCDVLVFVDSDIRPDPGFVGRLVGPLSEPAVGASTGFRWYHPPRPTFGSMLRSTWNAGALPFLVDSRRNFAWGGAMAIRRDVFERARVADAWDNALSDDFTFTLCVRKLGLEVRFVPSCIAVSHEKSSMAQTVEFTNRQSVISRVYFPPLWWSTAVGHAASSALLLYGLLGLSLWLVTGESSYLWAAYCLVLWPMQLANAAWLFSSVRELLPQLAPQLDALRWRYVMMAPIASLLTLVNSFHSIWTRRVTWRGIEYELRSPVETVIIGPRPDGA